MTNCFIKFMNWFIKASLCVVPEDDERKKKTLWHHWNFFCSHAQLKCGSLCVTNDFTQYKSFFNYHERYTSFSLMYIEIEAHNLWIMKNGAKERKWWRWWWWWGKNDDWKLAIFHAVLGWCFSPFYCYKLEICADWWLNFWQSEISETQRKRKKKKRTITTAIKEMRFNKSPSECIRYINTR